MLHSSQSMMSTAGVDYKSKTLDLDGRRLKLALWDTAGQERFNTVTNAYYRGAQGIVLVYDCTDQSSFNNIEAWLRNITLHASEDVEKILIANKTDMFHTRQVSTERGADLAADHGLPFAEVSAKANTGVSEAFSALLRTIVKNHGDVLERAAAAAGTVPVDRTPVSDERKCCS